MIAKTPHLIDERVWMRTPPRTAPEAASARNVMTLGWTSLLNDLGSEVIARLIPLYVSSVLGAPMSAVGFIEGLAESTATLLKPFFGSLSDRLKKRKEFVAFGYGLSALARPLLALTGSWQEIAFLRFCDRLGKGVRSAPRDALIADSSLAGAHGRNFGINRSMDTFGALLGVVGFGLWSYLHPAHSLDPALWKILCIVCGIPGLFALALVIWKVTDFGISAKPTPANPESVRLSGTFKRYLLVVGLFALANSSDGFIIIRARELGYSLSGILGLVALLNVVAAFTSIPAAALSDRFGRRTLIAMGWTIYALSYALFGSFTEANAPAGFAVVISVYGLFFGFTESVERAWIADLAPVEARGRAYGVFGLVVGVSALPASLGFGWLWDHFGGQVPFYVGSAIALFSTALLFILVPKSAGD